MLFKIILALATMAVGALAQGSQNYSSIYAALQGQAGQTDQLVKLLQGPQYVDILNKLSSNGSNGTYTLFAPSDAAITKTVQGLGANTDFTNILLYHIVNGSYVSSNFTNSSTILYTLLTNNTVDFFPNNAGLPIDVVNNGTSVQVLFGFGVANVTQTDIHAANGVVQIIDTILTPPLSPSLTAKNGGLELFYNSLNTTNSTSTLDGKKGITVFAPIDAAFSQLNVGALNTSQVQNILGYHIVDGVYFSSNLSNTNGPVNLTTEQGSNITITKSGDTIRIQDVSGNETAKVVKADIIIDNGVLHIIDTVLIPSQNSSIPNGTNTNFTNSNGTKNAANSLYGADFSVNALFVTAVVALLTILL